MNSVIVYDCPRHLAPDPSSAKYYILVPSHNHQLPWRLKGILPCFSNRYPTTMELDTCPWVELTAIGDLECTINDQLQMHHSQPPPDLNEDDPDEYIP
jgi:hypothetical protein